MCLVVGHTGTVHSGYGCVLVVVDVSSDWIDICVVKWWLVRGEFADTDTMTILFTKA